MIRDHITADSFPRVLRQVIAATCESRKYCKVRAGDKHLVFKIIAALIADNCNVNNDNNNLFIIAGTG